MHNFMLLFRVQMKERLRRSISRQIGNYSRGKTIALGIVVALSLLMLAAFWCMLVYGIFISLQLSAMPLELGLFVAFFASMLMTLFFSVASILGNLFHSRDVEFLSALPLSATVLFSSKIAWVYISELLTSLIFSLPAVIIYGVLTGAGVLYWFSAAGVLLILPMIPLMFATFISLLLARMTTLSRHREKIMIVLGLVLTLVFVIASQLFSGSMSSTNFDTEMLTELMTSASGLFDMIARIFPPAQYAANAAALTSDAATSWLLYLGLSLGAFALSIVVASRTYMKTAMASRENVKKSGKAARFNAASLKPSSPMFAFCKREIKNITRSVVYAMNSLIGVVMFPVMVAIIPLSTSGADLSASLEMFQGMTLDISNNWIFVIAFGIGMFLCMTNLVASTAFSREGESLWLCKVVPVPYRVQAYGKLLFAVAVSVLTILLSAVVFCFIMPSVVLPVVLGAIAAAAASVIPCAFGMMVDLRRPKLKWQSEAEAIKQNMNGVLGMVITMGISLVLAVVAVLVALIGNLWITAAVTIVLSCGFSAGSVAMLGAYADKKLAAL